MVKREACCAYRGTAVPSINTEGCVTGDGTIASPVNLLIDPSGNIICGPNGLAFSGQLVSTIFVSGCLDGDGSSGDPVYIVLQPDGGIVCGPSGLYVLPTSGGGADTNFAENDLTFDADRLHDLDGNKVDVVGGAITYLTLDSTLDEALLGAAGSHFKVDGGGLITFQGTGNDWKVEGSAGTAGQVITSNGPATPATWQDVGIAVDDEGGPVSIILL